MDYLATLREFHTQHIEPFIGKPDGCTSEEVDVFERQIGFDLPLAYRQYLLWMGKDQWGIFQGSDWLLKDAFRNTQHLHRYSEKLVKQTGIHWSLPAHYLACFSHQGYTFTWFELPKSDDNPEVWWFHEALIADPEAFDPPLNPEPQPGGSFTDYVLKQMQINARYLPQTADLHRAFRESYETKTTVKVADNLFVTVDHGRNNPDHSQTANDEMDTD